MDNINIYKIYIYVVTKSIQLVELHINLVA